MPEITVEGLVKAFGDQRALDHVDFTVRDGELFTLLGPSGCGKSTTLMSVAGFQQPEEGRIRVGEQAVFDAEHRISLPAEHRNLGIVFQSYAVWPHMTVYENLAFPLKVRRLKRAEIRARIMQTLELVEMTPYEKRYPHELSGGQQQRVALARALVYSPAVLLLDEPFSNLDAAFRAYMRAELKRIQSEVGQTMVYVTHDQVEAMSMADQIAVMDLGVLQQFGTPQEIYNSPANRFVAGFVGSTQMNFLPAREVPIELPAQPGNGRPVTFGIRPENLSLVAPDSADATLKAKVTLVEPLGAKDVVHVTIDREDVRVIATPGMRPRIGDQVGLAFNRERLHVFDDETGEAVR
jgi:ABC-type sugar transport system ATPase subunit